MRHPAQAMVEFALVISVFMLLVFGTFDLARAYLAYIVVTNSVREVSRYGAAHYYDSNYNPLNARQAGMNLAVGIDSANLVLPPPTVSLADGLAYITATGQYPFHSVFPGVGALIGDPLTLSVSTSTPIG